MDSKIKILDPVRTDIANVTIPIILEKYPEPKPDVEDDDKFIEDEPDGNFELGFDY